MSGRDTIKGCNFQHACAMEKAISLLDEAVQKNLVLEGTADKVDYEVISLDGEILEVGQVKTKDEPYQWTPSELSDLFEDWLATRPTAKQFCFMTNGSRGPEVKRLSDISLLLRNQQLLSPEQEKFLSSKYPRVPLTLLEALLSKTTITTRRPNAIELLDQLALKLVRLGVQDVEDAINRLFTTTALVSEREDAATRSLNTSDIAKVVGAEWPLVSTPGERLEKYRSAVREYLNEESVIPLQYAFPRETSHDPWETYTPEFSVAVASGSIPKELPIGDLLDMHKHFLIGGVAGSGKTTSLWSAARQLADTGSLVFACPAKLYRGERTEEFIADRIIRFDPLASHIQVRNWLINIRSAVFVDGLDECPRDYREDLFGELSRLAETYPRVRLLLSSRNPADAHRLGFPYAEVRPLEWSQVRRMLGVQTEPDGTILMDRLEASLGSFLYTPLAVRMVTALLEEGQGIPSSRWTVYQQFTTLMYNRDVQVRRRLITAELGKWLSIQTASFMQHRGEKVLSWSRLMEFCDQRLKELLSQRRFSVQSTTAEDLAEALSLLPWVRRDETAVSFTHNSFQEYFAAHSLGEKEALALATDDDWHEVIATWVSSLAGMNAEHVLGSLIRTDVSLIGSCWRNGVGFSEVEFQQYLGAFRDDLGHVGRHFPALGLNTGLSVWGCLRQQDVLYAVRTADTGSAAQVDLRPMQRLGQGDYARLRHRTDFFRLPPATMAYRDALDLLEQHIKQRLQEAEGGDNWDPFTPADPTDKEFMEFLVQANTQHDSLVMDIVPTLHQRIRRPGDLVGRFATRNLERVFVCRYAEPGAGPEMLTDSLDAELGLWIYPGHAVAKGTTTYVLEHLDAELGHLLYGFKNGQRWAL